MSHLKVLFASAEVAPFSKVGGLADVAGALPQALADQGVSIEILTPLYRFIDRKHLKQIPQTIQVTLEDRHDLLRLDVTDHGDRDVGGDVVGLEELHGVLPGEGLQVAHVADRRLTVGMRLEGHRDQ